MKRLVAISLFSLLLIFNASVHATTYRLRQLTANEYLRAIRDVLQNTDVDNAALYIDTITREWALRYGDATVNPDLAIEVLNTMRDTVPYWTGQDVFIRTIIQSLLDSDVIELNETHDTASTYEGFDIMVTPRDFNADSQPEWMLAVDWASSFKQLFVVARNNGQYHLIDTPLPWFGCCYAYYSDLSGFMEEQRFADMTGDGIPEWILAVGGVGGGHQNHGYLMILQWHEGQLVDISVPERGNDVGYRAMSYSAPAGGGEPPLLPYGTDVQYVDMDFDGTTEVIIRQQQEDNWACTWRDERIFSWNGNYFVPISSEREYDDVQGCAIRFAEEAMWARDYATAIEHYEEALNLQPTGDYFWGDTIIVELEGYLRVRLAIAYSLIGRDDDAEQIIASIAPKNTYSLPLLGLIESVNNNLGSALEVCQAAYDVFNFDCPAETDACLGSPLNAIVGMTLENSGYDVQSSWSSFPTPSEAGCDMFTPVQQVLSQHLFNTNTSPIIQLEDLGFSALNSIHFDF